MARRNNYNNDGTITTVWILGCGIGNNFDQSMANKHTAIIEKTVADLKLKNIYIVVIPSFGKFAGDSGDYSLSIFITPKHGNESAILLSEELYRAHSYHIIESEE